MCLDDEEFYCCRRFRSFEFPIGNGFFCVSLSKLMGE